MANLSSLQIELKLMATYLLYNFNYTPSIITQAKNTTHCIDRIIACKSLTYTINF